LNEEIVDFDGVIVDVRSAAELGEGHIPNAINVGLSGQFASWAGTFIPVGTPVAIAAENEAQVEEAFTRLARVGLESVSGFFLMSEYTGESASVEQISAEYAERKFTQTEKFQFVDVRASREHSAGHAVGTVNLPLNNLPLALDNLDPRIPTYVICQGGYRSSLATSILENAGFTHVYDVAGGTSAWQEAGLPTSRSIVATS